MAGPLINKTAGTLLKDFGAGNHKPGSGSAVAFQGMLSAQMTITVIDLTLPKRNYRTKADDLRIILSEINDKIYPELGKLMEEDSVQFDKVITALRAKKNEKDIRIKSQLANSALEDLRIATDMPMEIAKRCMRLAECALFVFDHGYQAARGDSSVAIHGALSAVAGCLSIINLNLLSFTSNEWTESTRAEADLLRAAYDKLLLEATDRQEILKDEADKMHAFHLEINRLKKNLELNENASIAKIEEFARGVQNALWVHRDILWKNQMIDNPVKILDPITALKKLGYQYQQEPTLGIHEVDGEVFEVAGVIDSGTKYVEISEKFAPEKINFTIAHELGHALLHPNLVLHRDRPMDGSNALVPTDYREIQANKFATFFLMPRLTVIEQFKKHFLSEKFIINQNTAMLLGYKVGDLRDNFSDRHKLARLIASTKFYNYLAFRSLAEQFNVSIETMAIRLEELDLV